MNAADQATSPETATKIAAIISLFKQQFPKVKVNLQPWTTDPDTQEWLDPDSIDIGLNLPAGHTLIQLRLQNYRLIGIEASCYGPFGNERWKFSTIGDWQFFGAYPPKPGFQATLKQVCHDIFMVFNGPTSPSS